MNKDLHKLQPRVMQILENSYLNKRLSHAYIFSGKKGVYKKEVALYLACMLYCGVKPCLKCENCQNILNMNHLNVIYIEPDGKTVKKEQILGLQEEFSKTSLVNGPRIYIIDEADTMSVPAMNSLLKFIEEPIGEDTYGILLTEHLENILPTIRSRSIAINFDDLKKEDLKEEIINLGYDEKYVDSITYLVSNVEQAKNLLESESFNRTFDCFMRFVSNLKDNDISLFVKVNSSFFMSRDDTEMFLNLVEGLYRDVLEYKIKKEVITFKNLKDVIADIAQYYDTDSLLDSLVSILETMKKLTYYTNINLLINELLIDLRGGKI